ncbi:MULTISPECIES: Zn-ribbon domain-containing OB-fold protein [Sphingobium]|uniref:Zn-ribbon domain-containing OB-fold protein n=1 Tax=Sphingobium tyrosinilyticum TaxID=2715436 RepID=A0ABV9EY42_9SPHN|nr:Zn-ribbon domain-containing OB-fold protein [Sphingobium sp. EP60837]ANI76783.1 hypothetical protein EP837_00337 [Sphingobium sp. EP60837]
MTATATTQRPLPVPDTLSTPFWAAARDHALHMQRCDSCGHMAYPPEIACRACGGDHLHFAPVSGRATLHSWTVLHEAPAPGFRDRLPLILAVVELEEQPGLLMSTNLVDADPAALRIGMPLRAWFENITDQCALVQFRPAGR